MAAYWRKFFILSWKNLLLKKRHWIMTILEIVIPTLLFIGIVAIRNYGGEQFNPSQKPATTYDKKILPESICESLVLTLRNMSIPNITLYYYPANDVTDKIVGTFQESMRNVFYPFCEEFQPNSTLSVGPFSILPSKSEKEIVTITSSNNLLDSGEAVVYGGVIFKNMESATLKNIPNLAYTLRLASEFTQKYTGYLFYDHMVAGPQPQQGRKYDTFSVLQTMIDLSYTQLLTNETLLPTSPVELLSINYITSSQNMPYPGYLENNLILFLGLIMPQFLVLSMAFIVPPILKRIVYEKQTGVKELMKMMGLPSWMHWVCWFINVITVSAISIAIITILLCVPTGKDIGPVLEYSNPFLVFLLLILYASALVVSLFVISTMFNSPNIALAAGLLVHILTFTIPNTFISKTDDGYASIPFSIRIILGFIPNINMIWSLKELTALEGKGQGLVWSSLFSRSTPDDPMTMAVCWIIFLVDIFLYSLLVWYIDNVAPGKFGVAKKFSFPFEAKYWCGNKDPAFSEPNSSVDQNLGNMFEEEPKSKAGIRVKDLKKQFKSFGNKEVLAVNGVTFSAFKGEIMALLGHNGAGKTTTMSVLTGMYSPSSGSAEINGYNIDENMSKIRESLGLCPQHNMLFEDLTVREHLVFFGMLKGLSKSESEAETLKYLDMLNMTDKTNVIVTNLSGGMKRKVNLGIALIGNSKILMLDEPTSGMDPEARRGMWDLLLSLKKDRTMLLTTHYMEEADVLGDRIAIMAKGKVKCYGTPFFLKQRYGSGYKFIVVTNKDVSKDKITRIETMIKSQVPSAELDSQGGLDLFFYLPVDDSAKFPDMFLALETAKEQLGITSFGLSPTTMEDVFLKVGEMANEETDGNISPTSSVPSLDPENFSQGSPVSDLLQGAPLIQSQMVGLLIKRMVYTWRRKTLYIAMMLIPIVIALLIVSVFNPSNTTETKHPNLDIALSSYEDAVTFVGFDRNSTACTECSALKEAFLSTITTGDIREDPGANLSAFILDESTGDNMSKYQDRYIIASDFQKINFPLPNPLNPDEAINKNMTQLTGVFNTIPLHSRPLAQNHISNTLLTHLEKNSKTKHSISVASHPMPEQKSFEFTSDFTGISPTVFGFGISFPIGISILVSSFIIFPLLERATNAKQVQIMAGVRSVTFWTSNLIWDLFMYLLSASIMLIIIVLLDKKEIFWTNYAWGAFMVILLLLGLFGTLFSYVFSFLAETSASGFSALIVLNVLVGIIAPVGFIILRLGEASEALVLVSDVIRWICNWFPIFPFTKALMAIISVQESNNLCTSSIELDTLVFICKGLLAKPQLLIASQSMQKIAQCCMPHLVGPENQACDKNLTISIPCHETKSFFTFDAQNGINLDIIMLCVDGLIYFIILVMIEAKLFARLKVMVQEMIPGYYQIKQVEETLDDDVEEEQKRINKDASYGNNAQGVTGNNNVEEDVLKVSHLQKKFQGVQAVNDMSFGVKIGECFGLLGINGAGKTTTFRLLTGDEIPTKGNSSLMGIDLGTNRRKYLSRIGYCPQFDSIIPELTGKELLTLMARIRGVKSSRLDEEVERWTNFLGIEEYIDRQSGDYSGGNKRKLNVAMSLVGEPPVVFLDEPSTGMDPVARRNLWNIIENIQKNGQSLVLTSHSMDECEALCDRMGIMVNGQFKCFGTVQHLKKKFAQGFTILAKLKHSVSSSKPTDKTEEPQDLTDISVGSTEPTEEPQDLTDISVGSTEPTDSTEELETQQLKQYLQENLDLVSVKDEHKGYISFHVGNPDIPWHLLFRVMEEAKQNMAFLEDYSISETTLEEVFLSFAKKQITDVNE